MGIRYVLGTLTLLGGLAALGYGISVLVTSGETAYFVAGVSAEYGEKLDVKEWLFRWRLAWSTTAFLSVGVALSGVGILRRRTWALLLLGCVAVLALLIDVAGTLTGFFRYAFETNGAVHRATLFVVATACFAIFWRSKHKTQVPDRT